MTTKKKIRKGPEESATKFTVGTIKKGNDGNNWIIIETKNKTHRWKKLDNTNNKTIKKSKSKNIDKSNKKSNIHDNEIPSTEKLKQLKKKYSVLVSGNKSELANGLYRVRRNAINLDDLELIYPLLNKENKKEVEKIINKRINNPITDFKGLWKPLPKPINKMTREQLIKNLKDFRNAWEKITTRSQDLSDERLKEEPTQELQKLIKFYYSDEAKNLAMEWLS
uniref:Uncharacterized protein n=2 Tax=Nucleocytoviricota sp. TaxID=2809609 RepID=A0A9E8JWU5_9VIRU|nr:hypothetical protein [Nucleocytoviricota sp.]